MKIVLFDTRQNDAQKDFAGGMGVGMHPGAGGWKGRLIRAMYRRDYRPVAMNFAYLAAIFKQLGHEVAYQNHTRDSAEVYVFNPSLLTLSIELEQIRQLQRRLPQTRILVAGAVAYALSDMFPGCTVLRGEPEQLLWKLDHVLHSSASTLDLGSVQDLDQLPYPDWSLFHYRRFKIKYDFWRFPTTFIQQSRGCTFKCNYCPYIMIESKTRFRDPEAVVDEIRVGVERYGFKSFKFRDPLFGLDRKRAIAVAEGILRLKQPIQFSVETRIDLMRDETLQILKQAGLTAVTVGIETPKEATLKQYRRVPINDDRQREFVAKCRNLGIRTVAGFMIGFPEDRRTDIMWVLRYAKQVNPTFANFNVVTPYPGTEFYEQVKHQIADHDYSNYSVYHPVMKYRHLTQQQVADLHAACFSKFYFRSRYLKENGGLLWPRLGKWIPGVYAPSTTPSTIDDENFSESANGSDPPSARSGHRAA